MSQWEFEHIREQARREILEAEDPRSLEDVRIKYLGRKGLLARIYASFSSLPPEEKPVVGKEANTLKSLISRLLKERQDALAHEERQKEIGQNRVDVTLPGVGRRLGHTHLITRTIEDICAIFTRLGFTVKEGPEVETEFNNFTALNIPVDHPSRDAFDTFYLDREDPCFPGRHFLLRSHTSPVQIRVMQEHKPPVAVVVPGRVYRPDAVDASHSFMFHQIEGLLVDTDVTFADLKGLLYHFCKRYFSENVRMRFRPHFFPFTEPSAEVDISAEAIFGSGAGSRSRKKWLEIMGCGMVHPNVFKAVGCPDGKYKGLAFGMGVERIAMLKHGITDIRVFFENDNRFLEQF